MKSMTKENIITWLSLGAVIASAVIMLGRSAYNASDLEIVPDSVEYAAGAYNMLASGSYTIRIQDHNLPPRYSPWFSAVFLLPAYVIAPCSAGAPVAAILLSAVAACIMAFRIGCLFAGTRGGILSAAFLLFCPSFRYYASAIMTDVPCTALCLAAFYCYLTSSTESSWVRWLTAGTAVALAAALRPVTVFLCLPFALTAASSLSRRAITRIFLVLLPSALTASATMFYNWKVFGSPLRSGYSYWCSVPYDYFSLTFGLRFLGNNASVLLNAGKFIFPVFFLALGIILHRNRQFIPKGFKNTLSRSALFFAFALSPLIAFHLFYFFPEERFYLPVLAFACACAGGFAGIIIKQASAAFRMILPAAILAASIAVRIHTPGHIPARRQAVDLINAHVPDHANVITAIDPAYASFMLRNRDINFIPISRTVEYASKICMPKKSEDPVPRPYSSFDHRAKGLMSGIHFDPVARTADEMFPEIAAQISRGALFFAETGNITALEHPSFQALFEVFPAMEISPGLYLLCPPSRQGSSPEGR